jgi:hypothetical protein
MSKEQQTTTSDIAYAIVGEHLRPPHHHIKKCVVLGFVVLSMVVLMGVFCPSHHEGNVYL